MTENTFWKEDFNFQISSEILPNMILPYPFGTSREDLFKVPVWQEERQMWIIKQAFCVDPSITPTRGTYGFFSSSILEDTRSYYFNHTWAPSNE